MAYITYQGPIRDSIIPSPSTSPPPPPHLPLPPPPSQSSGRIANKWVAAMFGAQREITSSHSVTLTHATTLVCCCILLVSYPVIRGDHISVGGFWVKFT